MQDVPNAPDEGPRRIDAITLGTTMGVRFNQLSLANARGAQIDSYSLEMDDTNNGAGPFTIIGGFSTLSTLTEYTILNLQQGKKYYFRYRAYNQ